MRFAPALILAVICLTVQQASAARLALFGCSQKNTAHGGHCARAIDGSGARLWRQNSCTHTHGGKGNWWSAQILTKSVVTHVAIYNRADCCQSRLNNFVIEVDGKVCAQYNSRHWFHARTFKCNAVGRKITIRSRLNAPLTLCEVFAYGKPYNGAGYLRLRSCSQKNTAHGGVCSRAIDGSGARHWNQRSCTHTHSGAGNWWSASTRKRSRIQAVMIYNRADCCQRRLNNFVIEVDGKVCAQYRSRGYFHAKIFRCDAVGSKVTIRSRKNAPLTLCEVFVYGKPLKGEREVQVKMNYCVQTNDAHGGSCWRAMDGRTHQHWRYHSCTHTHKGKNYWTGFMPKVTHVTRVTLYNRGDCCQRRLNNFVIEVDGQVCAQYKSNGYFMVKTFSCNAVGSTVTVRSRKSDYLTLCEVKVFGIPSKKPGMVPVRLNYCIQTNDAHGGSCWRAMDGRLSQHWNHRSCTHTHKGKNYWTGFMPKVTEVRKVVIYNRGDCCQRRLNDFVIEVDGHVCAQYKSNGYFMVKAFDCHAIGSTVTVRSRKSTYLTLCEVKVFGVPSKKPGMVPVKLNYCIQTNDAHGGSCWRAMDGRISQHWNHRSCTHTHKGKNYWTGFMPKETEVRKVVIYNRGDCCQRRLNDFVIEVDGQVCAQYKSSGYFMVKAFDCNAVGSTITVRSRKSTYLTLCEVQVFGVPSKKPGMVPVRLNHCDQTNTAHGGSCRRAMDGRISQHWNHRSCTHTHRGKNYWTGYMPKVTSVRKVVIYNRGDCCQKRLNDFVIEVDGKVCAQYKSRGYFMVKAFDCNAVGSTVTVRSRKTSYLTLCEVQVFGVPSKKPGFGRIKLGRCSQKNTAHGGVCGRAIDGSGARLWRQNSCTHTHGGKGNWWSAYAKKIFKFVNVAIYNRADCCQRRLNNFDIEVDGKICAQYKSHGYFHAATFKCNAVGRKLTIRSNKNAPLTLCEVFAYGIPLYGRHFKQVGCYVINPKAEYLSMHEYVTQGMTLAKCADECKAVKASRMIVQKGQRCLCAFDMRGLLKKKKCGKDDMMYELD